MRLKPPLYIDKRIQELLEAKNRLEKHLALKKKEQDKAVEEARTKERKRLIEEFSNVLPPNDVLSTFNKGSQRLGKEVRKVLNETL